MKKKAFVLLGTPNENGYTKKMLDILLRELSGTYDIDILNSYKSGIKPCIDCKYCQKNTTCIYDDYQKADTGFRKSDLLIVATPVYNLSFPAPLKAIFDRTQIYYSDRFIRNIKPPIKKHKEAVLLLTSGSNDKSGCEIIKKQLNMIFTILNASLSHEIILQNTDNNPSLNKIILQIKTTAKQLNQIISG